VIIRSKSAIAPAIIAVIVIVVIVVAGAGAYVALSSSKSSASSVVSSSVSSSSSAPPSSSSSSSSSAPVSSSSSVSTTSTSLSIPTMNTTTSSSSVSATVSSSSSSTSSATSYSFSDTCSNSSSTLPLGSVIPLLSSYSSMKISLRGTSNGKPLNLTEAYTVNSKTDSQYNVSLTYTGNVSESIGTVLATNGSILALEFNGTVIPSQDLGFSSEEAVGIFAGFIFEIDYSDSLYNYTQALSFHATGTSTVTIGSVTIPITTWAANSLPVTVDGCSGSSTLSTFSLSEGTPAGASVPLVTYFSFAGTSTSDGTVSTVDFTIQVEGLTVA
jgi:hypothetical protein